MTVSSRHSTLAFAALVTACLGAAAVMAQGTPDYAKIIAAPDRSEADRTADKRRDPLPFLQFAQLKPGMKVLDMGAGGGYSTELIARVVTPNGTVYGQNAPDLPERPKAAFEARMKGPAGKNIVAVSRPFDDPVPPEAGNLDAVTFLFYYHDTTYMKVDRAQMDKKLFAALKPGGLLVIADHSAKAGEGTSVSRTNHRVEESVVRNELQAAGFKFVAEGNFWRHPEDPRDFNVNRPTGPVDNFVLKFQKP